MSYRVRTLRKAKQDIDATVTWISKVRRAPRGAAAWLSAFEAAAKKVANWPDSYSLAPEDELDERELRQFFFKTRRGKNYRAIFTIQNEEILILRVRGPGQDDLEPSDL